MRALAGAGCAMQPSKLRPVVLPAIAASSSQCGPSAVLAQQICTAGTSVSLAGSARPSHPSCPIHFMVPLHAATLGTHLAGAGGQGGGTAGQGGGAVPRGVAAAQGGPEPGEAAGGGWTGEHAHPAGAPGWCTWLVLTALFVTVLLPTHPAQGGLPLLPAFQCPDRRWPGGWWWVDGRGSCGTRCLEADHLRAIAGHGVGRLFVCHSARARVWLLRHGAVTPCV